MINRFKKILCNNRRRFNVRLLPDIFIEQTVAQRCRKIIFRHLNNCKKAVKTARALVKILKLLQFSESCLTGICAIIYYLIAAYLYNIKMFPKNIFRFNNSIENYFFVNKIAASLLWRRLFLVRSDIMAVPT